MKGSSYRVFALILVLATVAAGCANRSDRRASANDGPAANSTVPSGDSPTSGSESGPDGESGAPGSGATNNPEASSTERRRLYTPDPNFPINIEYAIGTASPKVWEWDYRLCVERGQTITVTIKTVSKGFLTLVATYQDGNPRESYGLAEASPEGRYDWKWVVPPEAPVGNGLFVVSVKDEQGSGESRPDDRTFKVDRSC